MPKSRYDEKNNKSRHAAADEDCCEEMSEKYGWKLVDVEKTQCQRDRYQLNLLEETKMV